MFWVRWFYSIFIHTNQPLITSFYIKNVPFFAELAMSQRWSAIFCSTAVWGSKPIGRMRVNRPIEVWMLLNLWPDPILDLPYWPGPHFRNLWSPRKSGPFIMSGIRHHCQFFVLILTISLNIEQLFNVLDNWLLSLDTNE